MSDFGLVVFFLELASKIDRLLTGQEKIMNALDDIKGEVTKLGSKVDEMTDVIQSGETLLSGLTAIIADLRQQLENAGLDPVKVQAIIDGMKGLEATVDSKRAELAASIVANTPAAPPAP